MELDYPEPWKVHREEEEEEDPLPGMLFPGLYAVHGPRPLALCSVISQWVFFKQPT